MPTLDEVKGQLREAGLIPAQLLLREVGELPRLLDTDERIVHAGQGTYKGGHGLLVATNKRLLFLDRGWVNLNVETFDYSRIQSVEYKSGAIFATLTVTTAGNSGTIEKIPKPTAEKITQYIRSRSAPTPSAAPSSESVASQLTQLARLREQGVLTAEEFEQQKRKLLG